MHTISQNEALANMPVAELEAAIEQFLEPVTTRLPDQRLGKVVRLAVQGISSSQSPIITQMARGVAHVSTTIWAMAKRFYRLLANRRIRHRHLLKGLYAHAQQLVAQEAPAYVIVALDPVNFEKPYCQQVEGVSTVMKSTPPTLDGKKRLTRGYPAMTATIVNLSEPALTYASWFSYTTADFLSQNYEIERAIRITRALLPTQQVRFVGDAGLDDQKILQQISQVKAQGIIRAYHNRNIEVYNQRLDRWEQEQLLDFAACVPLSVDLLVDFSHARKVRHVKIQLGWFAFRLPEASQHLWAVVAHHPEEERDLVLLTHVPISTAAEARLVYDQWRERPSIEHTYRFQQEAGLDVEDMRVHSLEAMRRLFVLVLLTALFVAHIDHSWPAPAVSWLRSLGGKLGLKTDLDGLYVLLAGIGSVFAAAATLTFTSLHPFPFGQFSSG
jgi:hypothetical protein